jgi:hypothetical protein
MPAPCNAATSPRLQRVLAVLADGRPHTTLEIVRRAHVVAADTAIRELRGAPNNLPIQRSQKGYIHTYQLAPVARLKVLVGEAARLADDPEQRPTLPPKDRRGWELE